MDFTRLVEEAIDDADLVTFKSWLKAHDAPVTHIRYNVGIGAYRAFLFSRLPELKEPLRSQVNVIQWQPGGQMIDLVGATDPSESLHILRSIPFDRDEMPLRPTLVGGRINPKWSKAWNRGQI